MMELPRKNEIIDFWGVCERIKEMTRKEIKDLTELLLALEEDSPMPDKRKITQLKIILEKLDNEEQSK